MIPLSGPKIIVPPPGPKSRAIAERLANVELPHVAARREARAESAGVDFAPITYARTQGSFVEDEDGNVYVDLAAGFGACVLGHAPEELVSAIHESASKNWLALGDLYGHAEKAELCERLAALLPDPLHGTSRVALGMSGADALTAAMKTCALYTKKPRFIAFEGAYHGLSYAPLAACGLAESFRAPFSAHLGAHVSFVPYPKGEHGLTPPILGQLDTLLSAGDVGGVLIEPVLGRGGCLSAAPGTLATLRALCDRHGALLVADEVWTGMGRSGAMLMSTRETLPDLVCVGKGLGGGYPISACIGRAHVMQAWGAHGGATVHTATHFGQPAACAAALSTLHALSTRALPERAASVGASWRADLARIFASNEKVEISGVGLMVGVHLADQARALRVMRSLLHRGYLVVTGGTAGNVLTLTPPLNIAEELLQGFNTALQDCLT